MTKREECIEAMARAIVGRLKSDCIGWDDGKCYAFGSTDAFEVNGEFFPDSLATAAFDACLKVLMEPSEAMLDEGWQNTPVQWMEGGREALHYPFVAMLQATPQ